MDSPESRVKLLESEAEQFKSYLSGLPTEAWGRPSACEGWSVADVVAHVVGQDFALRISRGLQGDASPPEGSPAAAEHNEDRFAENIFQRALSARERLGDRLLATLTERLDEAVELFSTIGPDDWDTLCYWSPGPEPVRTMLDMRISELTMHAWDVRSRLDSDYHLSDGSVLVLDRRPKTIPADRPEPPG